MQKNLTVKMDNHKFKNLEQTIQEKYTNTAGIAVIKEDSIIYENYFNGYEQEDTIHVASVTKSIISILIGIAIDKGAIKSVDQKVLDFFPDYQIKRGEKTIQKITLKNLLTMTAPYKYKSEPYSKVYSNEDWTKAALDLLGGKGIIGEFKYSTVGVHILSGILVSATGRTVLEFATENLFKPLEIEAPNNKKIEDKEAHFAFLKDKHVSGWVVDSKGVNTAGWGLTLRLKDMAKIGQLYLKQGKWNGKQIVSSKWIEESTKESSRRDNLPYGYMWWIVEDKISAGYAALGDGGNVIYVSPKENLVVAIASSFKPRAKDRIELIRDEIMPFI